MATEVADNPVNNKPEGDDESWLYGGNYYY